MFCVCSPFAHFHLCYIGMELFRKQHLVCEPLYTDFSAIYRKINLHQGFLINLRTDTDNSHDWDMYFSSIITWSITTSWLMHHMTKSMLIQIFFLSGFECTTVVETLTICNSQNFFGFSVSSNCILTLQRING